MRAFEIETVSMNEVSVLFIPLMRKLAWVRVTPSLVLPSQVFPFEMDWVEEELSWWISDVEEVMKMKDGCLELLSKSMVWMF